LRRSNIGEIRRVKANLRYRILIYHGVYYLIDTGVSPWKSLSLFFFLLCRNPGYKIDEETALKLINSHKAQPRKVAPYVMAGMGISASGIFTPLNNWNVDNSMLFNIVITILLVIVFYFIFLFILKKLKQNVEKTINYTALPKQEFKIYRPKFSHILKVFISRVFFIAMSTLGLTGFIQLGNLFILFISLSFLVLSFLLSSVSLDYGEYKIK
jgi:uncharacterized membrane protein (TIGR01218 family)